jgi:hypothetical protein
MYLKQRQFRQQVLKNITCLEIIFLCLAGLLFLYGCSNDKTANFLPTAIQFRDALVESDVWAEVIHYTYEDLNTGKRHKHAIVMFKYPLDAPSVRLYDKDGSFNVFDLYYVNPINADQYAKDIALKAEQCKKNYHHSIIEAEVIK